MGTIGKSIKVDNVEVMHMIILTSSGLSSEKLIDEMKNIIKPNSRAVIITTASKEYKERDKNIPHLVDQLHRLECSVDFIDIEFESAELLKAYDLIMINGGNPYYLMKWIQERKADIILKSIQAEGKPIVGVSAGSLVLQERFDLIDRYTPQMNYGIGVNSQNAAGLVSVSILPHYSTFKMRLDKFEELVCAYEMETGVPVQRLDDGEAIMCNEEGAVML